MKNSVEKKLNFLTWYALISTCIFGAFVFSSFSEEGNKKNFEEISVKRINVLAEDGEIRMVLSNENRQHSGRLNGQDFEKRERPAGILFFNEEGDECGGLIHYGKTENGKTHAAMSFTMDQYKEDQVIQILNSESYKDGKEIIKRGIRISDLPTGSDLRSRMAKIEEITAKLKTLNEKEQQALIAEVGNSLGSTQRLFLGRTNGNNSGLFLAGPDGKQRLLIYVDKDNVPHLDYINEQGEKLSLIEN